ncbi:MAG: LptA/OstA family protein [Kiritimatiellia bacterium]|jgi:lipopolysaccharide transport protein LptA|nr:LptA/OstA family protein [Kiritimatiellia bacterium]MDP6630712.1 LptA/OstA family protein [Kiritimatiellia bacterium]MDP6809425.1 LptA/OstA family protein [Kiritimatiellia bacterium]MDP7023898.1 LptA/OstA family protein [Kiritimatiellia bacterium]
MKRSVLLSFVCLAGMACGQEPVSTNALPATTNQTIITSDRLEYDYPRAIAVFTGNVLVRDKDLKMWSDKMTVIFAPNDEIESVTAIGRVVIIQPGRRADCRKAIFLMDRNEVILTGDAKVVQGNDRVEGRVIHIWTDTDRMVSEPGHLVVSPKEEESVKKDSPTPE